MKGLTISNRTTKKEGTIKLRFRLRDSRDVDLYYKSDIVADLGDLSQFSPNGTLKSRVRIYNVKLEKDIKVCMDAIENAYRKLCLVMYKGQISQSEFVEEVNKILYPEKVDTPREKLCLLDRFVKYIDDGVRDDVFCKARANHYRVLHGRLERFLRIKRKIKIIPSQFDSDLVLEFRFFLINECDYVSKYPSLYKDCKKTNIPQKKLSHNTVATKMKLLHAFFEELTSRDEVLFSPFSKLGKQRRQSLTHEEYYDPICLTIEELLKIYNANELPENLMETRDCFLLQCAFGCRINEFKSLSMDNVAVDSEGIPYIHYFSSKTIRTNHQEIVTPIVRYAFDLIKKWKFNFPILNYVYGKSGYNAKIKLLLEKCGIDRMQTFYDEEKKGSITIPISGEGCSKLCRKTFVDVIDKVQIDKYAAGLHKRGSKAVERYTYQGLKDRFLLYSIAFRQPLYKVDKELNVIETD